MYGNQPIASHEANGVGIISIYRVNVTFTEMEISSFTG